MPKKRGPPKGSSRAPSKNTARLLPPQQQRPNAAQWSSSAPSPLGPPPHQHSTTTFASPPATTEAPSSLPRPHPPLGLDRHPASLQPHQSFAPSPPHGQSMPRPSMPPPPDLPRASGLLLDPYRGSYVSLPHPTGPSRPKFRGGSSGILDFPSSRGSSFLRHSSIGSQFSDNAGRTSPSSFALKRPPIVEDSPGRGGIAGYYPESGQTELPAMRSSADRPLPSEGNGARLPPARSDVSARSRAPEDIVAESILPSHELGSNSFGGPQDSAPPGIREPHIPATIEDDVWKLYWQFPGIHWPILVKKNMPVIRGKRRVDAYKQPLLYNAAMSLAARIWDVRRDGPMSPMTFREGESPRVPTPVEISEIYFCESRPC